MHSIFWDKYFVRGTLVHMRLLSVMPLAKAFGAEALSYYATQDVRVGAVVKIPLRKKIIQGLVVESKAITDVKSEIRSAGFSTKKIESIVTDSFFLPSHVSAAKITAELHATQPGTILSIMAPKAILEKTPAPKKVKPKKKKQSDVQPPIKMLQAVPDERFSRYKSMVRESFARGNSVFVLVPSVFNGEMLFDVLSKGIEERSFFLSNDLPLKILRGSWTKALESTSPVLVIATYSFLSFPREDIGLYIIEGESSPNYKLRGRPHIDVRVLTEQIAHEMRAECVYGDTCISLETMHRFDTHEIEDVVRPSMKFSFGNSCDIVDMQKTSEDEGKPLQIFSPSVLSHIENATTRGHRIFVYAVRRGFAPLTVCRDCGKTLSCDRCDAPMVLHARRSDGAEQRLFSCHRCGHVRDAKTVCDTCQSWRLEPLGLGVERVIDTLRKALPGVPLFEIHGGVKDIDKKEKEIAEKWRASKNGILIGTERALPHLAQHKAHTTVVASIDSLVALPDFRMSEKIFSLLIDMRTNTLESMFIQTRSPEQSVFAFVVSGDGSAFFRHEKALRESYGYPPFTVPIKISRTGPRETILKELELIAEKASPRDTAVYPAFVGTVRNQSVAHLLITVPRRLWPDKELLALVSRLSPAYDVDVIPRSFL